jgi:hypothetical protein
MWGSKIDVFRILFLQYFERSLLKISSCTIPLPRKRLVYSLLHRWPTQDDHHEYIRPMIFTRLRNDPNPIAIDNLIIQRDGVGRGEHVDVIFCIGAADVGFGVAAVFRA